MKKVLLAVALLVASVAGAQQQVEVESVKPNAVCSADPNSIVGCTALYMADNTTIALSQVAINWSARSITCNVPVAFDFFDPDPSDTHNVLYSRAFQCTNGQTIAFVGKGTHTTTHVGKTTQNRWTFTSGEAHIY